MGPLGGKRKHWGMEDTHIFLVGAFVVSRAANKMLPAQPIGFIAMCGPWSNVFGPQCVGRGSSCGAKKKISLAPLRQPLRLQDLPCAASSLRLALHRAPGPDRRSRWSTAQKTFFLSHFD